ncbi:MAG: Crp/Fnr family transcriptional regulator [Hyphomicrobiaceae bacterium]|jgi:CRP-like cAMP-binding protein
MLDRQVIADHLARTPLFKGLDPAQRADVARLMREATFTSGQVIFSRGDPGREVFLVLDGKVRLSVVTVEGRELAFSMAGPGGVFGEIAALDGGTRTAFATATTPVKAASLSHVDFNRLVASTPPLADAVIRLLCSRLRDADQQLEGVALHRIEVRLARYLVGLLQQRDPQLKQKRATLEIGMSQGELALLLGATRPKVNAALAALEETGAITRNDQKIECDVEELRALAEVE